MEVLVKLLFIAWIRIIDCQTDAPSVTMSKEKDSKNFTEIKQEVDDQPNEWDEEIEKVDSATKVSKLCQMLAQFTPNLCDNDVANEKCTDQSGEGKNLPGMEILFCELMLSQQLSG